MDEIERDRDRDGERVMCMRLMGETKNGVSGNEEKKRKNEALCRL